jgi:hypothetical protein
MAAPVDAELPGHGKRADMLEGLHDRKDAYQVYREVISDVTGRDITWLNTVPVYTVPGNESEARCTYMAGRPACACSDIGAIRPFVLVPDHSPTESECPYSFDELLLHEYTHHLLQQSEHNEEFRAVLETALEDLAAVTHS